MKQFGKVELIADIFQPRAGFKSKVSLLAQKKRMPRKIQGRESKESISPRPKDRLLLRMMSSQNVELKRSEAKQGEEWKRRQKQEDFFAFPAFFASLRFGSKFYVGKRLDKIGHSISVFNEVLRVLWVLETICAACELLKKRSVVLSVLMATSEKLSSKLEFL